MKTALKCSSKFISNLFSVLPWLPKRLILGKNRNLIGSPCLLSTISLIEGSKETSAYFLLHKTIQDDCTLFWYEKKTGLKKTLTIMASLWLRDYASVKNCEGIIIVRNFCHNLKLTLLYFRTLATSKGGSHIFEISSWETGRWDMSRHCGQTYY